MHKRNLQTHAQRNCLQKSQSRKPDCQKSQTKQDLDKAITAPMKPFQFDALRFDNFPGEEFRFTFREAEKSNIHHVWMESKRAKYQWTADLADDVSKYGPSGVPANALFDFLRVALSERNFGEPVSTAEKGPQLTVTCMMDQCSKAITLELIVLFTEAWSNVYKFVLAYKEISKAEVLAAKLRDAEEEIARLKEVVGALSSRPTFKVKGGSWSRDGELAGAHSLVVWNPAMEVLAGTNQHMAVDNDKLRVLREGVYKFTFDATQSVIDCYNHGATSRPWLLKVYPEGEAVAMEHKIRFEFYMLTLSVAAGSVIMLSLGCGTCAVLPSLMVECLQ